MRNRALHSPTQSLVRVTELLELLVRATFGNALRGGLDPGEDAFDPAYGEGGAFIWHQCTNSTPAPRGKPAL